MQQFYSWKNIVLPWNMSIYIFNFFVSIFCFLKCTKFKQKNSLQDFLYGKILFIWHAGTSNTLLFCVYFLYALENTYLREVSNFVLLNEIKVFEFYQNRRLTVVSFYEDNHIFLVNNTKQKTGKQEWFWLPQHLQ